MRLIRLVGFSAVLLLSLPLGKSARAQTTAAQTGSVEGVVVDAKDGAPISDVVVRLSGGPFDPAVLSRFKTALGAINVTLPPPGDVSMDAYIETINDLAAARGMALNNPQLQNAIGAFRNGQDERFRGQTDDAGRFSIQNLPPGRYSMTTQRTGYFPVKAAAPGSGFTVTAKRVTNVTLAMTPGATIAGKVTVPAGQPQSSLTVAAYQITYRNGYPLMTFLVTRNTDDRGQFRLYYVPPGDYLVAVVPRNLVGPFAGASSSYDPAGVYTFSNIPESRYRVQISQLPTDAYVEDIRLGSTSIFDSGFSVDGPTPGDIEVILSSKGAQVQGTVRARDDKPFTGARVVLVPAPIHRGNPARYKNARTNDSGTFTLKGVAPGEYKLFAWENVLSDAWTNAAFIARYEQLGHAITVSAAGTAADVRAIPNDYGR